MSRFERLGKKPSSLFTLFVLVSCHYLKYFRVVIPQIYVFNPGIKNSTCWHFKTCETFSQSTTYFPLNYFRFVYFFNINWVLCILTMNPENIRYPNINNACGNKKLIRYWNVTPKVNKLSHRKKFACKNYVFIKEVIIRHYCLLSNKKLLQEASDSLLSSDGKFNMVSKFSNLRVNGAINFVAESVI